MPRKIFPQEACQASWQRKVELSANLVGGGQVIQHLFNHELGLSIWVGAASYWMFLCQGKELWCAVHSGRTWEDEVEHTTGFHHLIKIKERVIIMYLGSTNNNNNNKKRDGC